MRNLLGLAVAVILGCSGLACGNVGGTEEGGANGNDRTNGGDEGEVMETGAMAISPSGAYIVARRNTTTLIVDVNAKKYTELEIVGERFAFSKKRDVVYVVLAGTSGAMAIDLKTATTLWKVTPAFTSSRGAFLAKVTDDDTQLLVADYDRVFFLDAQTGDVKRTAKVGAGPVDLELLPGEKHAVVVSSTTWGEDGGPHTPVSLVDVAKEGVATIDVPNCAAPIAIPDASRVLLSPTFCQPGKESAPKEGWKNPDPVSVIDIDGDAGSLKFIKNLPGFGPVAMTEAGKAIAYLDMKRIDPAMFEDPSQIPSATGPQYHLMTIDPKTTKFDLHAIGASLPRFAPSTDGRSLLVDASVTMLRSEASATVTFGPSGIKAEVKGAFGDNSGALFGVFDLETKKYTPFQGPAASLDRFVQLGDGSRVFTLKNNGRGGDLFSIDMASRTSSDLGRNLRDIGILPDGMTLVLRIRLSATADGYLREEFCITRDAQTCLSSILYTSPVPQHDP